MLKIVIRFLSYPKINRYLEELLIASDFSDFQILSKIVFNLVNLISIYYQFHVHRTVMSLRLDSH